MDHFVWNSGKMSKCATFEDFINSLKEELARSEANPCPPDNPMYGAFTQQTSLLRYLTTLDQEEIFRIIEHVNAYAALLTHTIFHTFPDPDMVHSTVRQACFFGYMVGATKDIPEVFKEQ